MTEPSPNKITRVTIPSYSFFLTILKGKRLHRTCTTEVWNLGDLLRILHTKTLKTKETEEEFKDAGRD